MHRRFSFVLAACALFLTGCASTPEKATTEKKEPPPASMSRITKKEFGKTPEGAIVDAYTLKSAGGLELTVITYGAIVQSLVVPAKDGSKSEVTLGFDTLEGYLGKHPYFGAVVGRYGNRIAKARFTLNGKAYTLAGNNNGNHLHGGLKGFDKAVWSAQEVVSAEGAALELKHVSPDGDEGYPGALTVTVRYTVTDANEVKLHYTATTDKDTVVNLTNHAYFNLSGGDNILDHQLKLAAGKFTPVDAGLIPTGELKPVAGTPFDFTQPAAIGARIDANDEQIKRGGGYDHNFVLDSGGGTLALAAEAYDAKSGRVLQVSTDQPGVQFYTGNFLDGTLKGRGGKAYGKRAAFCLETQHFPDSPNQPNFPSTVLKAGATYDTTTVWKFSVR